MTWPPTIDPLARLGDLRISLSLPRDGDALSRATEHESDLAALAILAARAGRAPAITPAALDRLAVAASSTDGPAELRAGCAWAVAAHDPLRGAALAGALVLEPEAAFWLASIVARRGGCLAVWTAGLDAEPAMDRAAAHAE
jgi:hypothetical protein